MLFKNNSKMVKNIVVFFISQLSFAVSVQTGVHIQYAVKLYLKNKSDYNINVDFF